MLAKIRSWSFGGEIYLRCSALLYTYEVLALFNTSWIKSATLPHWGHRWTLRPFKALLIRPVFVLTGAGTVWYGSIDVEYRELLILVCRDWYPEELDMALSLGFSLVSWGGFEFCAVADVLFRSCRSGMMNACWSWTDEVVWSDWSIMF
jgi:hypothetical protein